MAIKHVQGGSTKPATGKPVEAEKSSAKPVVTQVKAAAKPDPVPAKPVAAKPVENAKPAPVAAAKSAAEAIEKSVVVAKTAAPPVQKPTIQNSVEKEAKIMQTTVETTAKKTQAQANAMFGDINDRTKGAMEKSAKMVEEMNDFAKGNMEAMVESSRIAAKGMESIGQEAAEYSRKSFEQASATMKSMASVKSPTELFKLQSDFMRSAFDMYVAEASKTTEHMMKLAGDAAQPLSNRMAIAADKVKIAA